MFSVLWACGCGPLGGAAVFLGNSLIFHSPEHWSSLCIHLFPTLVLFTLRHNSEAVLTAWPGLFDLHYFNDIPPWQFFVSGSVFYVAWFIPYFLWMTMSGLSLPARGHDTVFHANMRGGSASTAEGGLQFLVKHRYFEEEIKQRAASDTWEVMDLLPYLLAHAFGCFTGFACSAPFFYYRTAHVVGNIIIVLCAIRNGASTYNDYILNSYKKCIKAELQEPDAKMTTSTTKKDKKH